MPRDRFLFKKDLNQFTGSIKAAIKFLLDYPAFTNLGIL
jgi:hypothetical protein